MNKNLTISKEINYKKINKKWLKLHFKATVSLVIITFILECIIGLILYKTGHINTTIPKYLLKFLILPTFINFLLVIIEYNCIKSRTISLLSKMYIVSLILVLNCFIIFTVHSVFSSLFYVFAVPILLTSIYGSYTLSVITGSSAVIMLITSEVCIQWDADNLNIFQDGIRLSNFIISIVVLIFFIAVSMIIIYFEKEKQKIAIEKEVEKNNLQKRLHLDELTGISNRIALNNFLEEIQKDTENSYIFVMIDIDNFKILNDTYGHLEGDKCLVEFGRILHNNSPHDRAFRYGGDEFALIFKNTLIDNVVLICDNIRSDLKLLNNRINSIMPVTASFGISEYNRTISTSQLIMNADKAMYKAKIVKDSLHIFNLQESLHV